MSDIRLILHDCFDALADLPDESVDAVITDPPYFLDKMKTEWSQDTLAKVTKSSQVSSLPAGMKFDPKQGKQFQAFMGQVSEHAFRVLKPGGFMLAFSAPRLTHRLGVAIEDEGFHIRDMWAWLYTQNQMKAMSVARFLDGHPEIDAQTKAALAEQLARWKTPQIKSCLEPIICAQKPPKGTFLNNWLEYGVGLVDTSAQVGVQMAPANVLTSEPITSTLDRVFLVPKPTKGEKGDFNDHASVKPLALMAQLVRLVVPPGGLVLDPFNGSGSTGIAAAMLGRSYMGIEANPGYFSVTRQRFEAAYPDIEWLQPHAHELRASV